MCVLGVLGRKSSHPSSKQQERGQRPSIFNMVSKGELQFV